MHNDISKNISRFGYSSSQQIVIRAGITALICFAILRPITLIGTKVGIGGINILEIFGTSISYLFLLPLIAGIKQIRFDRIGLLSIMFCFYCVYSILWGSEIRAVLITILPFLLYFSVRTFITDFKQVRVLLIAIYISFLIPIVLSTFNIITGRNLNMIEFWNELPRHAGAFSGSHTLAYSMLLVSFFFCILQQMSPPKNIIYQVLNFILLFISVFCLYQSHTRTVIIGFIIFWYIYLFGKNKKIFFSIIVLSLAMGVIFQSHIDSIFWKTPEQHDIDRATSGRIKLFKNNTTLFFDSNITQQLFGRGLGHDQQFKFHNDYMSLLISLGIVGLLLYLILFCYLLFDVFLCKDTKTKYLFGAIFISIAAMNFGSNGFVFRIELSQYFWLLAALFYSLQKIE